MTAPTLTADEIRALPAVVEVWPTVGKIYGLGRSTAYDLARRNELPVPVMQVGAAFRVRLADILRDLHLDESGADGEPNTQAA